MEYGRLHEVEAHEEVVEEVGGTEDQGVVLETVGRHQARVVCHWGRSVFARDYFLRWPYQRQKMEMRDSTEEITAWMFATMREM